MTPLLWLAVSAAGDRRVVDSAVPPDVMIDDIPSYVSACPPEQHNARELKLIMNGSRPTPGTRCVRLYLKPTQYDRYARATVAHGGKMVAGSLKDRERALMNIIAADPTQQIAHLAERFVACGQERCNYLRSRIERTKYVHRPKHAFIGAQGTVARGRKQTPHDRALDDRSPAERAANRLVSVVGWTGP
jgi:hypothetical protein